MTSEELIAEACRRYPPGTVFKSIFSDGGKYRKVTPYWKDKPVAFKMKDYENAIGAYPGMHAVSVDGQKVCSNPVVYKDGKWAPGREYDVVKEIMDRYE